jgi:hypothetical protein
MAAPGRARQMRGRRRKEGEGGAADQWGWGVSKTKNKEIKRWPRAAVGERLDGLLGRRAEKVSEAGFFSFFSNSFKSNFSKFKFKSYFF